MVQVVRGTNDTKCKALIYANAGIGKSTLGSRFKKPYFINTEGSCDYLGVARSPKLERYMEFEQLVRELVTDAKGKNGRQFDTIVIDTIDELVDLTVAYIKGADEPGLSPQDRAKILAQALSETNGGYGKGNARLVDHVHDRIIKFMQYLIQAGYDVVMLAHTSTKDVSDGEGDMVEKLSPRVSVAQTVDRKVACQFIDFADCVYFLKKQADGKRVLLTEDDGRAVAKNRLGLTGEIELTDDMDVQQLITFNYKEK